MAGGALPGAGGHPGPEGPAGALDQGGGGAGASAGKLEHIYRAASAEVMQEQLEVFAQGELGKKYPKIADSWRRRNSKT
jgi:hypothetical protein